MRSNSKLYLPLPVIPGPLQNQEQFFNSQTPMLIGFILCLALFGLTAGHLLHGIAALIIVLAALYHVYLKPRLCVVTLNKNNLQIKKFGRIAAITPYNNLEIYIDEAPKVITHFGTSKSNYRYRLSFRDTSDQRMFVIYPEFYMADNLRDITERINSSVSPAMPIVFSSDKLRRDYETAYDIKA